MKPLALASLGAVMALAASQLAADCNPTGPHEVSIYGLNTAPLGRTATITEDEPDLDEVRGVALSRGVALAVHCWDDCDYTCVEPTLTSSDPTVVRVAALARQGVTGEHVLVGVAPGQATLTLHSRCADKTYPVTVTAP